MLIGKATKVVWRWETKEEGLQIVERRMLKNYVDVYLTDFKYFDSNLSKKYSLAL